jgi:hypothetical protein
VFFVEARYHNSPKRAADQVRYIAHREEGLRDGQRRELYGIGPRYRAFRGDERAIRRALVEDARGLRKPVYFRFILTVDNRTADRFARLDGRLAELVLRDSVGKTFRGAARGVQGVFAIHQHGGDGRPSHPHVHALLSPRLQNGSRTHLSPKAIQAVRERWEREVLRGLERQERRIERARRERPPVEIPPRHRALDHVRQLPLEAERLRRPRGRLGPVGVFFLRTKRARRLAGLGKRRLGRLLRPRVRLNAVTRDPERAARRTAFRLATGLVPGPIRDAMWMLRGAQSLGLRLR